MPCTLLRSPASILGAGKKFVRLVYKELQPKHNSRTVSDGES
ncbi:hypothetical protein ACG7TL_004712 [Trametes sanguinea]